MGRVHGVALVFHRCFTSGSRGVAQVLLRKGPVLQKPFLGKGKVSAQAVSGKQELDRHGSLCFVEARRGELISLLCSFFFAETQGSKAHEGTRQHTKAHTSPPGTGLRGGACKTPKRGLCLRIEFCDSGTRTWALSRAAVTI